MAHIAFVARESTVQHSDNQRTISISACSQVHVESFGGRDVGSKYMLYA